MERFVHRSPSLGQPSFLVGQCSPFSNFSCVDCTGEQVDRKICESLSDTRQIRSYLVDLGHSHHGTVDYGSGEGFRQQRQELVAWSEAP